MSQRPVAIVVICWFIIILAVFGVVTNVIILFTPEKLAALQAQISLRPITVGYILAFSLLNPTINLALAICMLYAVNWARHVYLAFNGILYVSALILVSQKLTVLLAMSIFFIFLYFLFNERGQQYFVKHCPNET